jgi:hypothetical protein
MSDGYILDTPEQIAAFRLSCLITYAEARARGMHLTRAGAAPRLANIRAEYGIKAKTWAEVGPQLRAVRDASDPIINNEGYA